MLTSERLQPFQFEQSYNEVCNDVMKVLSVLFAKMKMFRDVETSIAIAQEAIADDRGGTKG